MVIGYNCTEQCGYQAECDVADDGERICPDCGMAVLGINGDLRPSSDTFRVAYGSGGSPYEDGHVRVNATTPEQAFNRAQDRIPEEKVVIKIDTV